MRTTIIGIVVVVLFSVFGVATWTYWKTYNTPEYEKLWGWFPTPRFIPLYERKVQTDQVIKIGLITDTQVHPNRINRTDRRPDAPRHLGSIRDARPLKLFVERMKEFQPQMIIHGGDIIEGTGDSDIVGMMGLSLVETELKSIGVPVYWVLGNHELRSVTKEQFRTTLSITPMFREADQVIDVGDYRFILLDANYYPDGRVVEPGGKRHIPGYLHPETLAWLRTQLDTDRRVIVIMHQGAFDRGVRQWHSYDVESLRERQLASIARNGARTPWGNKRKKIAPPDYGPGGKLSITNAMDLRALLAQYNVDAFINGHLEVALYEEADGVRYYSLTGTKKSPAFQESFYELTLRGGVPDLVMHYTDAVDLQPTTVDFEDTFRVRK